MWIFDKCCVGWRFMQALCWEGEGRGNTNNYWKWVRPRKKNVVLPCCPQRPTLFKNKNKKSRVGESTQICSDWVFFEKNDGICTQIWPFLVKKKIIFRSTDPTFSEIPLEGNTTIIFFLVLHQVLKMFWWSFVYCLLRLESKNWSIQIFSLNF